jgi:hypothetical protein
MELPQGKPVLIFVFNIMNPTQAQIDSMSSYLFFPWLTTDSFF